MAALLLAASALLGATAAAGPPVPTLQEAFAQAARYEFGQSRLPLSIIADAVADDLSDPARRAEMERRLVTLLEDPEATRDCRQFVCRQLARIGTAACVPALGARLRDEDESHLARYALQRIDGDAASRALRGALDDLQGQLLVGVINSIAQRRDAAALKALTRLVESADRSVATASVAAIGRLGTPAASDVLLDLARASPDDEMGRVVHDALLVSADKRRREHDRRRAAALYRVVLVRTREDHRRMAALRGLAESAGPAAVPRIVRLLEHEDEVWRSFAAEVVRSMEHAGATRAFVGAI
ncbi:MAG: HEAT repeat domain-containing protein, partial [Planctomycetota bacterium]